MLSQSVPKNLIEALIDGVDSSRVGQQQILTRSQIIEIAQEMALHMRNFLAHKFTPDLMDLPQVSDLWNRITGENLPVSGVKESSCFVRVSVVMDLMSTLFRQSHNDAMALGAARRNSLRAQALNTFKVLFPGDEITQSIGMARLELGGMEPVKAGS